MALKEIGPAVFNGGFSTFLAFVLLANSNSYGFALFFRVSIHLILQSEYTQLHPELQIKDTFFVSTRSANKRPDFFSPKL